MITRQELKDEVNIQMALQISRLSKDVNTKIGCVIVSENNTPISWGYNGCFKGVDDTLFPHSRENEILSFYENGKLIKFSMNKYPFMLHAEYNAIEFSDKNKLKNATIYVMGFPCVECAKKIADNGIKRVVVHTPTTVDVGSMVSNTNNYDVQKYIFAHTNIELVVDGEVKVLEKN